MTTCLFFNGFHVKRKLMKLLFNYFQEEKREETVHYILCTGFKDERKCHIGKIAT